MSSADVDHLASILNAPPGRTPTNCVGPSVTRLNDLVALGVFGAGPFTETYTTDDRVLEKRIREYSQHIVTRKFCLEVTQNCNFRCRYCPYTQATQTRHHSHQTMSRYTAFRAIDWYFARYVAQFASVAAKARGRILRAAPPALSWYGGEPFLNFELIKTSKDYFAQLPWSEYDIPISALRYSVTTNFSLVSEELLEFLTANDVTIHVSLDGPRAQNDLHRITVDGNGTFDVVYNNLQQLRAYDRKYYKSRVFILATSCPSHDSEQCTRFLTTLDANVTVSPMETPGRIISDTVAQAATLKELSTECVALLRKLGESGDIKEVEMQLRTNKRLRNLLRVITRKYVPIRTSAPICREDAVAPFNMRTCPIGFDNLFVSVDGRFHMCHKTDGTLPIGSCSAGYDLSVLIDVYRAFHRTLNRKQCRSCWAVRFCNVCSAPMLHSGMFVPPDDQECECLRRAVEITFEAYQVVSEYSVVFSPAIEALQKLNQLDGVVDLGDE
ncbi:MAG: radical SAM protein [Terriglobales bacterium]